MKKTAKKPFNQKLFNLLTVIAIAALVGYAALLTWVVFQFQESNVMVTQSLAEENLDLNAN